MIWVVVDSNIYVSALVFGGTPSVVLQLAEVGAFQLVVSEAIKAEVMETLTTKFGWSQKRVEDVATHLWQSAQMVYPVQPIRASRDPDDNHILECALESHAQIIVTGDNDLLTLHPFRGLEILSPAVFLDRHLWEKK